MGIPLSWLREFVDIPWPTDELVELLPMLGIGVERTVTIEGDVVLDLETASNRPDLLSLVGVARELAAWGRLEVRLPPDTFAEHDPPASSATSVEIADTRLCSRYIAHVITGVAVGPSPPHIAARLEAAGIRPINNVVDATNYVMLEWGQPLHAFDLDSLVEHRIVVRPAHRGETLVTLDGLLRVLDSEMLVIADARRAVALAGIMGGVETEIHPATRTVLLEAAAFLPASVRRASRRLGLRTEASMRFERGIDPEGAARAARRAAGLIAELTGGRVMRGTVDAYPTPVPRPTIALRLPRIARLLGAEIPVADVVAILTRLGLEVRREAEVVRAVPPIGRRDLECEEDLIEEIARHHGYDRIPEAMPVEALQQGRWSARLEAESAVREILIRTGLTEAMSLSLLTPRLLDRFDLDPGDPWRRMVPVLNPLTADHTHLRSSLLPGLLEAVRANVSHRRDAVHLFEIGRTFAARDDGAPVERRSLAMVMRGRWLEGLWTGAGGAREVTYFNLRGVLESLVFELRAGVLSVDAHRVRWLHPNRAGRVALDGEPIGWIGELHPDVAAQFDLPGRTQVAELDLEPLLDRAVLQPRFAGVPRFPAVHRDVAVVAPVALPHARILSEIRAAAGDLLERVELFDAYEGPPLAPGQRNLAYALTFRASDRTLAGEEVDALVGAIHAALQGRLSVAIRT